MRKVLVYYRDAMDNYRAEWCTGPYTGDMANSVKKNLHLMGCTDFRIVPYKDGDPDADRDITQKAD